MYQRYAIDAAGYGATFLITVLVMTGGHCAVALGAPPQEAWAEMQNQALKKGYC